MYHCLEQDFILPQRTQRSQRSPEKPLCFVKDVLRILFDYI